jgi:serine/threonine protein kinase/Tol biopolymer transport system component
VIGETISHYTVLGTLGRGGMGVVYKAEDVRLKRQVALKFLSDDKPFDHQMLERFRWEAQAASALNHPNICTIYDIDEADGRPFIAMELLEGRSLRDVVVDDGALPSDQVVEIGIQISDALVTAHASGIIHRDLKPANVFLTTRHQAKLLDFGLAKAVAARAAALASQMALAETGSPVFQTNPGFAVGTAGYMAPEQIRDDEVDARTDVFALGIVLYELATGRPAFPGRTLGIVQDAVLNRAPEPPSQINADVPPKLEEVIARCLEKDPDLRYQTAADLRGDLKRVLRDQSTQTMAVPSGDTSWRRTPTPAPVPPPRPARRARRHVLAWLAIAMAGALAWFALGRRESGGGPTPRLSPFTTLPGQLRQPVFSPEGNQIAFAWNGGEGESFSLYTQLVDAGAPLRLTTTEGEDGSPAWSPDGRFIAFLRRTPTSAGYFIVPALGGVERPLRASYGVPFSYGPSVGWSPDGALIAIVDRERAGAPLNVLLVDVASGSLRPLLDEPMPYLQNPTFTTDGRTLAFVGGRGFLAQDLYTVPLAGGAPRRLTTDASHIAGITWTRDDREIIFSSNRGGLFSVWKVGASGGQPELVTAVGEDAYAPTLSRRSGHLAYLRLRVDWNLWRAPGPISTTPDARAERLIYSTREEWQPAYSPDGMRIAFVSSRSGSQEIWAANSDGSGAIQLTSFRGPPTGTPRWSPDGRRIVLDSRVGGNSEIFIVGSDGSGLTRVTTEPSEDVVPSWSRDGRFIYFTSDRGGREQVWKVDAAGGAPARVLDAPARDIVESADGAWLYFWRQGVWRVPAQGGAETRVAQHPKWGSWLLSGDTVYLLNEDAKPRPTIDAVDVATGARTALRELDDWPHLRFPAAFALSPDGASFLFGRVDQMQNDVMLIQHFERP